MPSCVSYFFFLSRWVFCQHLWGRLLSKLGPLVSWFLLQHEQKEVRLCCSPRFCLSKPRPFWTDRALIGGTSPAASLPIGWISHIWAGMQIRRSAGKSLALTAETSIHLAGERESAAERGESAARVDRCARSRVKAEILYLSVSLRF